MNTSQALVILDAQVNMFDEEFSVYEGERIVGVLSSLIVAARSQGVSVIYVRNSGGEGEPDEKGTPGWEIHPVLKPTTTEIVIDKDSPDAFENTNLQAHLAAQGIKKLVVGGMQTEMCVDTSVRRAIELGYEVVLVEDGHSTFDFDDLKAVDKISQVNTGLRAIAQVVKAENIVFP